jgi:hypothetical protein
VKEYMMRYIQTILYSFFIFGVAMGIINSKPIYASEDIQNEEKEDCVYIRESLTETDKKYLFQPLGLSFTHEISDKVQVKTTEEVEHKEIVKPTVVYTHTPTYTKGAWTRPTHDPKKHVEHTKEKDQEKSVKTTEFNKDFYAKTTYVIQFASQEPKKEHQDEKKHHEDKEDKKEHKAKKHHDEEWDDEESDHEGDDEEHVKEHNEDWDDEKGWYSEEDDQDYSHSDSNDKKHHSKDYSDEYKDEEESYSDEDEDDYEWENEHEEEHTDDKVAWNH